MYTETSGKVDGEREAGSEKAWALKREGCQVKEMVGVGGQGGASRKDFSSQWHALYTPAQARGRRREGLSRGQGRGGSRSLSASADFRATDRLPSPPQPSPRRHQRRSRGANATRNARPAAAGAQHVSGALMSRLSCGPPSGPHNRLSCPQTSGAEHRGACSPDWQCSQILAGAWPPRRLLSALRHPHMEELRHPPARKGKLTPASSLPSAL